MQHRIYVGPFDAVDVLGVTVAYGQQIEVSAEEADDLDRQPGNWAKPTTVRGKQAAGDPAEAPATPPLQPPPVGEDDGQTGTTDMTSPAPGDGTDNGQEAGQ